MVINNIRIDMKKLVEEYKKNYDYIAVDSCLSNSNNNKYLEIGYEKRSEIFRKYWKILRS